MVSAVDPICLHCKICDAETIVATELEHRSIPDSIRSVFTEKLILTDTPRRWLTTIGQFSIIRLERDTQLVVPAYDYCMPEKECPGTVSDDPCTLFSRIHFPGGGVLPARLCQRERRVPLLQIRQHAKMLPDSGSILC